MTESTFEFDLDERVQAVVEGRVLSRKDSSNRENEYLIEYDDGHGGKFRRWLPEHALDEPDEPQPNSAVVIPMRAA